MSEPIRNFDNEWGLPEPKTFVLRGHTLKLMPDIPADTLARFEGIQNTDAADIPAGEALDLIEQMALTCLLPESHDDWRTIISYRDERIVGIYKQQEIIEWMIGEIGGRPFTSAPTSTSTPATQIPATSSTAISDSLPDAASQAPPLRSVHASTSP